MTHYTGPVSPNPLYFTSWVYNKSMKTSHVPSCSPSLNRRYGVSFSFTSIPIFTRLSYDKF